MKIEFKTIDHIMLCIPVGKEEEARHFYTQVLGLTELNNLGYTIPNGAMWFEMGNIQLHIKADVHSELHSQRHPAFIVSDLDAIKAFLLGEGVAIRNDSQIPDRKRFSFWDPFGNRIELIEML